jgi:hypothetical protein
MSNEEYETFKIKFWSWFDKLSTKEKEKFWYFAHDMAETNFYFSSCIDSINYFDTNELPEENF